MSIQDLRYLEKNNLDYQVHGQDKPIAILLHFTLLYKVDTTAGVLNTQ